MQYCMEIIQNPEKIVDIEIAFKNNELKIKVTDEGTGF